MCYPVCRMVHIKEPLLLIGNSSPCGDSGFPISLSEWSFTMPDALYTVFTRRYVARVDKSHPLIALNSQFSVTDPLISRMVDSLAADITFSQFIEISTIK